jgi:hypothetical protein
MEHSENKPKWKRVLFILFLVSVIIFLTYRLKLSEDGRSAHTRKLEKQLADQQKSISEMQGIIKSQGTQLKEYKPYQAVVRAAALRDSIYTLLPFKFGETVYIMPDSIRATVNAVNIMGNASEYSIKYQVRTKKGDYVNISITDLTK